MTISDALAGLLLFLATPLSALAADLYVPANYATIQAAVNAAVSGDTIHIAPGVYVEQITITNKNLTLAGAPGAVIRAKAGMALTLSSYGWLRVGLLGIALSDVVIRDLTLEGERLASAQPPYNDFVGIIYAGSNGRVEHCSVQGFRGATLSVFGSFGLLAGNPVSHGTPVTHVDVLNSTFADNDQSIDFFGDDSLNPTLLRMTFTIEGNVITGNGPTPIGTQLGIGIGTGAGGDVRRNTITDHAFTGGGFSFSYGIDTEDGLAASRPQRVRVQTTRFEGNTFRNNQLNLVSLLGNGSRFINNTFLGPGTGYRSHGLVVSGEGTQIRSNHFSNLPTGILLLGDDPDFGTALGTTTNATLIGNRFCDVTKPIDTEPLVTGTTNQGTLLCPFLPPTLAIAPAVLLAWPDDGESWTLQSAPDPQGPWSPLIVTPMLQDGQNSVGVKTDSDHRFFRLH